MKTKRSRRTRKKRSISLVFAIAACCVCASAAGPRDKHAKAEPYGILAGTVFRDNGYALPGAEVKIAPEPPPGAKPPKLKVHEAVSDHRGEFAFRVPVEPMHYRVHVKAKGFGEMEKTVAMEGEERIDVSFALQPSSNQ